MKRVNPPRHVPPVSDDEPNDWAELGLQVFDPIQLANAARQRDHETWVKTKIQLFLSGESDVFPIGAFADFKAMVDDARLMLDNLRNIREHLDQAEDHILSERDRALAEGDRETASAREAEWSQFSAQYAPFMLEQFFPDLPGVCGIGELKTYLDERLRKFTPRAMGLQTKLAKAIASIRATTDPPPMEAIPACIDPALGRHPFDEASLREIWPELFTEVGIQTRPNRSAARNRNPIPAAVWVGLAVFGAMVLMGLVIGLVGR